MAIKFLTQMKMLPKKNKSIENQNKKPNTIVRKLDERNHISVVNPKERFYLLWHLFVHFVCIHTHTHTQIYRFIEIYYDNFNISLRL